MTLQLIVPVVLNVRSR